MRNSYSFNLASLGISVKTLFSGYLFIVAIGYLMALIQLQLTHGLADGEYGLSVEDVSYSYYGNRSGSLLENKLNGSMSAMATDEERAAIIKWVHDGADKAAYSSTGVEQIITTKCTACHSEAAGMSLPDFTSFETLHERAEVDTGATIQSLARVSHIHLFGIAFIFMFVGLIFTLSTTVPLPIKVMTIGMPYVFLFLDIASWWLTKINPNFAWLVMIAGGLMALTFAIMWCVSMFEMWILPMRGKDYRNGLFDE